jgi:hypothetical protein
MILAAQTTLPDDIGSTDHTVSSNGRIIRERIEKDVEGSSCFTM